MRFFRCLHLITSDTVALFFQVPYEFQSIILKISPSFCIEFYKTRLLKFFKYVRWYHQTSLLKSYKYLHWILSNTAAYHFQSFALNFNRNSCWDFSCFCIEFHQTRLLSIFSSFCIDLFKLKHIRYGCCDFSDSCI